ncbi:MAG TPA: transcriptional repressor LexA [Bryobacteraceae bacterium]|nr:transcriptional repressor LexA [Bryobacteraceae bacterium]
MALTKRQKQVLDFLADFIEKNGYSPSYHEIAHALELASLATVHKHVSALEAKHYLRRSFNQSRSLEVSGKYLEERRDHQTPVGRLEVPLLGRIAAGSPVEAVASNEALNFADFLGKSETYALEVRGDSMIEDHICSGDFVLVERVSEVKNGDIVVALVDGMETTLKRLYREADGSVRLQPANSAMQPIIVPPAALHVQGRVLAVLRKYQ